MKKLIIGLASVVLALASCTPEAKKEKTLCEAFEDKFLVGAAVNQWQVNTTDEKLANLIKTEFNCLVAENCMKGEVVSPEEGVWDFKLADEFVDLCEKNKQACYGHCLVWHAQAPKWIFSDKNGNPVDKETLVERMKNHIRTVVGRYKGRVKSWDVVNEAIEDDGSFRQSPYYNIIGEEFCEIAFKTAQEVDPDCELYYNDYSMDKPAKRDAVIALVKSLREKGCRVDGVGMQSHVAFDTPLDEYEKTIEALAAANCKVMITELDLSVLPWPNGNQGAEISNNFEYAKEMDPYKDGLPEEKDQEVTDFYIKLFNIYLRHADAIERVNFWGVSDGDSWKNDWPIKGRTDYPLAFDRNLQPKKYVEAIKALVVK